MGVLGVLLEGWAAGIVQMVEIGRSADAAQEASSRRRSEVGDPGSVAWD
jgi:hypothetical protein